MSPASAARRRAATQFLMLAAFVPVFALAGSGAHAQALPRVEPNDMRTPAGRMVAGELRIELETVQAEWYPRGPDGPRIETPAFAEAGGPPMVPGPLIRATAGTPIVVGVRNRLDRPVAVRGLLDRTRVVVDRPPEDAFIPRFAFADSLVVPPGERREVRFTPGADVSSFYFGSVVHPPDWAANPGYWVGNHGEQGGFIGALVVDEAGVPPPSERIFLITRWGAREEPSTMGTTFKMMINGASWPHTERLEYAQGDTVHWRVINASLIVHPMHLHGFFFDVLATGDTDTDTRNLSTHIRQAVTEPMLGYSSMRIRWIADRPGNWIFHCHFNRHMGPLQRFASEVAGAHSAHSGDDGDGMDHMAGLVTGITVHPRPGAEPERTPRRRLDLWTGTRADVFADAPELGFVLQNGAEPPAPDSTVVPGSTILLERGQPTEIVVHNRLAMPLSVHWHGLELESVYDGVGNWSGSPGATRAPIPPGDSVKVHITPPRAGTFIYHVHGEDAHQLAQGLYGPLLVVEPGAGLDRDRDRVFLLSERGATREAPPAINGVAAPLPERFTPGIPYRLRFIHISADAIKAVRLLRNGEPVQWIPVAKDGADLPPALRIARPAEQFLVVGETYDFEWTPDEADAYTLEVETLFYSASALPPALQRVAFGVGSVTADALAAAAHVPPPPEPAVDRSPAIEMDDAELRAFVGVFGQPGMPITFTVEYDDAALWVTRTGRPRHRLVPIGPAAFRAEGASPDLHGARFEFEREAGRITAIVMGTGPGRWRLERERE